MSKGLGAILSIAGMVTGQPWLSAIGTGVGAVSSLSGGKKGGGQAPAAPGAPPATDPAAQAARDAASEEERRKRVAGSSMMTNPTGGLGDPSTPSLAAKSLLGQ